MQQRLSDFLMSFALFVVATFWVWKHMKIGASTRARGLYVRDNFFDRPLEERRAELEYRLAQALAARKAKGK